MVRVFTKCPCKVCPDRDPECHGRCDRYREWVEEERKVRHLKWVDDQRYIISDTKRKYLERKMRRERK